jgi:hypothetical protein
MRKTWLLVAAAAVFAAAGVACSSDSPGGGLHEAPIESAEVVSVDTNPPQFFLEVVAGLPNACYSQADPEVSRSGTTVRVRVLNRHSGAEVCAEVYGTYSLSIRLPGNYQAGTQYTVRVNDEVRAFTP